MDSDHIDASTLHPFPVCVSSARAEKCLLQQNSPLPDSSTTAHRPPHCLLSGNKGYYCYQNFFPDKKAAVREVSSSFLGTQMEWDSDSDGEAQGFSNFPA